jgi:hypothetical protein
MTFAQILTATVKVQYFRLILSGQGIVQSRQDKLSIVMDAYTPANNRSIV